MNNEYLQDLTAAENEFSQEVKGEGSLSAYAFRDENEGFYIGYDIHPENLSALYFDGIKLPRWESIKAKDTAEQTEIYQASFQKVTDEYPLISRVSDTDQGVVYTPEEVVRLREELERVPDSDGNAKAARALQKFYIACNKAAEQQMGLRLIPS